MKVTKTAQEWQQQLSPETFYVARQSGTEAAFSGKFYDYKEEGLYRCICCNTPLFESDTKFDSGTGWPSYYEGVEGAITEIRDETHGMARVEVKCTNCNAHLGHVFSDGPEPTGQRYCINSVCLDFEEKEG